MHLSAALLLSVLPLGALAGLPHQGSLRRRHFEHARSVTRRGPTYKLVDDYNKDTFFDMFDFFTESDPTHGRVTFLGKDDAKKANLTYVQDDGTIVMAVDDYTTLSPGQNRNSIHINSKKKYDAGSLIIADMWSMPHGCSTWPAYWTVGSPWPDHGEVDILENVNEATFNQITAHTGDSCELQNSVKTTGRLVGTKCTSSADSNSGCPFVTDQVQGNLTYGRGFNMNGGGVFAHTWTNDAITVWFFPRGQVPQDITDGNPNPDNWGTPAALFQSSDTCNIEQSFQQHQIVFDITLCGDWAGAAYASSGCPGTCDQAVADPNNFKFAKFKLAGLKVYQQQ
ncbi:hypothetical protein K474DRAFT_649827 [Panus rudis PR-1116 ss-1]|nr:hypothetical protein K474DRAFT_649827 [Panus rudis PR-1116 ss-1]